jgi:AraC-like DNA-binding protein
MGWGRMLGAAIQRGNAIFGSRLQSRTSMRLEVRGGIARWSYRVLDAVPLGRQQNEILALGYMLQLLRRFLGDGWVPVRTALTGGVVVGRRAIEAILGCEIDGGRIASVGFAADHLEATNPAPPRSDADGASDTGSVLPADGDFVGHVEELMRLSLLDRQPSRGTVARRLGTSVRTLHRRLWESRTSFAALRRAALERRAVAMLAESSLGVSGIAYELGYSDPAHFTRAFVRWRGVSPQEWRRSQAASRS